MYKSVCMRIMILLLFAMPIFLFAQPVQADDSMLAGLASDALNHYLMMDDVSRNISIDTFNKLMIERAILDTLNTMGAGKINAGNIIQLDIDFAISDEFATQQSIDVTIQIVYDNSGTTMNPLVRDSQSRVLTSAQVRLIKSFTIGIDDNLTELADLMQNQPQRGFGKILIQEKASSRPAIFMTAINGVFLGYTYSEIEAKAFENRRLTGLDLPDGIQIIGERAFANNRLTALNIPDSVINIEERAFLNNRIEKVTISDNVQLGKNAIGRGFEPFYNRNGKKAGNYVYVDRKWTLE